MERQDDVADLDKFSSAVAHHTQRTASKIVKEWYLYTIRRKILHEVEKYLRNEIKKRVMLVVLREWFELSMSERLNFARREYLERKRREGILRNSFQYWYWEHYLGKRDEFRRSVHLKLQVSKRFLRETFQCWRLELDNFRISTRFKRRSLIRRAFGMWHEEYHRAIRLRFELGRIKKKRIFLGIREYVQLKKKKRAEMHLKFVQFRRMKMSTTFGNWVVLVQYSMSKRYKILEWQIQQTNTQKLLIIRNWRLVILRQIRNKTIAEVVQQKHDLNIKSLIFSFWFAISQESYREKAMMIISGLTARRQLLSRGLDSFKAYLVNRRRSRSLKEKSELFLASYVLRVLLRNGSSYGRQKAKLIRVQKTYENSLRHNFWMNWMRYLHSARQVRAKVAKIRSGNERRLIERSYRVWNYVWFKVVTDKMIVECITVKIEMNIKKRVFHCILYFSRLKRSGFWEVFENLIASRVSKSFGKLYANMLLWKKREELEDQFGDRIRMGRILRSWREQFFENKKVSYIKDKMIICRFISHLCEFSRAVSAQDCILGARIAQIKERVFGSWRSQSRRKKNLQNVLDGRDLERIAREIVLKVYFTKWLLEFSGLIRFRQIHQRLQLKTKKIFFGEWRSAYNKLFTVRDKSERLAEASRFRFLNRYFRAWTERFARRSANNQKAQEIQDKVRARRITWAWKAMRHKSGRRVARIRSVFGLSLSLKILVLSRAWNSLKAFNKYCISIERSSNEYRVYIVNKQVMLVFNHWRYFAASLIRARSREEISQKFDQRRLKRMLFGYWREAFEDLILRNNFILENRRGLVLERVLFGAFLEWRVRARKRNQERVKIETVKKALMRTVLQRMVSLFNKINSYKKSLLNKMSYEFINSFVFRLRYRRVVEKEKSSGITLDTTIEMYLEHMTVRKSIDVWMRIFVVRIQQRRALVIGIEKLELIMVGLSKRKGFEALQEWKEEMNYKEKETEARVRKIIIFGVFKELQSKFQERKFTIQVSDLLYRNFLERKLQIGLRYWREKSIYQRESERRGTKVAGIVGRRRLSEIFSTWKKESNRYYSFYRLRRSLERPILRRVWLLLRLRCFMEKSLDAHLRSSLREWRRIAERKRDLRDRSARFEMNFVVKRRLRRNFEYWRKLYSHNRSVLDFHHRVTVATPIRSLVGWWRSRVRKRLEEESKLANRIRSRIQKSYFRSITALFRVIKHKAIVEKRQKRLILGLWKGLYVMDRRNRERRMFEFFEKWRIYSERKLVFREKAKLIGERKRLRLMERSLSRMVTIYGRNVQLRQKGRIICERRAKREKGLVFGFWLIRLHEKQKERELEVGLMLISGRCRRAMYLRIWRKEVFEKQRVRDALREFESRTRSRVLGSILGIWRNIWRPHYFKKTSAEMMRILNKAVLHNAFHHLLKVSFYSYTYHEEKVEDLGFERELGMRVDLSYKTECRCTEKRLRGLIMAGGKRRQRREGGSVGEILEAFSRVVLMRNEEIIGVFRRFRFYMSVRQRYERVFKEFESTLRIMVLVRSWEVLRLNLKRVFEIRTGLKALREKMENRRICEGLVRWVDRYNQSCRDHEIVEYMKNKYGQTIKVKCYLIWLIKFEIGKRKRRLRERSEEYYCIYLSRFAIRRMKEYFIYVKWQEWCKKACDTIKWVHDFRMKSQMFIGWRRYSERRERLKSGLYKIYKRARLRSLEESWTIWVGRLRRFREMRALAERSHSERIYLKGFQEAFKLWRILAERLRKQRLGVWDMIGSRRRNLTLTCFRLWKFFIYYRKTRSQRFNKITGLIQYNHFRLISYKVFLSWKLKTIELKSLKSSIFSFLGGVKSNRVEGGEENDRNEKASVEWSGSRISSIKNRRNRGGWKSLNSRSGREETGDDSQSSFSSLGKYGSNDDMSSEGDELPPTPLAVDGNRRENEKFGAYYHQNPRAYLKFSPYLGSSSSSPYFENEDNTSEFTDRQNMGTVSPTSWKSGKKEPRVPDFLTLSSSVYSTSPNASIPNISPAISGNRNQIEPITSVSPGTYPKKSRFTTLFSSSSSLRSPSSPSSNSDGDLEVDELHPITTSKFGERDEYKIGSPPDSTDTNIETEKNGLNPTNSEIHNKYTKANKGLHPNRDSPVKHHPKLFLLNDDQNFTISNNPYEVDNREDTSSSSLSSYS
ncbi:hypothetical protein HWI79_1019 [Cryptosporidium felis]|nr:hypothetical protein HWI79_1019 [Cryptosporidium felis]